MQNAHAHGRPVIVWTVNEPSEMRLACNLGVDGIVTDEPELLALVREEWRAGKRHVDFDWRLQARALWVRVLGFHFLVLLILKDLWVCVLRATGVGIQ